MLSSIRRLEEKHRRSLAIVFRKRFRKEQIIRKHAHFVKRFMEKSLERMKNFTSSCRAAARAGEIALIGK